MIFDTTEQRWQGPLTELGQRYADSTINNVYNEIMTNIFDFDALSTEAIAAIRENSNILARAQETARETKLHSYIGAIALEGAM